MHQLTCNQCRLPKKKHVINAGQLCNSFSSDEDKISEPLTVVSIPILYKNHPLRDAATGTDVSAERLISKSASDISTYTWWSAKNDSSCMSGFTNQRRDLSLRLYLGNKKRAAHLYKPNFGQSYSTSAGANYNSDLSKDLSKVEGFDICLSAAVPPLDRDEDEPVAQGFMHKAHVSQRVLRPGMLLWRNHLTLSEQVLSFFF